MKINNKGFISISIIYSFFIVFLLLMLSLIASYTNKKILLDKMEGEFSEDSKCIAGDLLSSCLILSDKANSDVKRGHMWQAVNYIYNKTLKNPPAFFEPADTEDESGMFMAADDYGDSYYYRGIVENNYVVFNDFVWRVIRINGDENLYGDGSIRMIYQGKYDSDGITTKVKADSNSYIEGLGASNGYIHFNNSNLLNVYCNDAQDLIKYNNKLTQCQNKLNTCEEKLNKCKNFDLLCKIINKSCISTNNNCIDYYENKKAEIGESDCASRGGGATALINIGYMNGSTSPDYDVKYGNEHSSSIKNLIDYWYENNFSSASSYLSDKLFCGDKDRICKYINTSGIEITTDCSILNDENISGILDKYFYLGDNRIRINPSSTSLKCPNSGTMANNPNNKILNLSRYTVDGNASITSVPLGNGSLTYPIGLLSADEMVMAGGAYGKTNDKFYLYTGFDYWSMTLAYTDYGLTLLNDEQRYSGARYFGINQEGQVIEINDKYESAYVRPVINLKSSIVYCSGKGTASDPYQIGLGSCS